MKNSTIFQFVGFETAISPDEFILQWENFAKRFFVKDIHSFTLRQQVLTRNKLKFFSKNEWPQDNFHFNFMGARYSEYFPDHKVKVQQLGGYSLMQPGNEYTPTESDLTLYIFLDNERSDLDAWRNLPCLHLNLYEAYYENSTYSYILEYFIAEETARPFLESLRSQVIFPENGLYKDCLVLEG